MSVKAPLYIIDGSGYIFRAYYAIRHLTNSKGLPTNAVYGFTQMLLRLIKEEKPEYLLMVFDSKEPSFRKKEYEAYKANREVPPDDLVPQFDYIKKVVEALDIPRLEMPGFEADDIIATVAKKLVPPEQPVVIVTGDKDLMQLVNHHVVLLDEMKNKRIDIAGVKEKFGVTPEQVVDVLGLMGDSSDNIPGVPGVGPKTASQWIAQYGSMENLFEHLDDIKGKKGEDLKVFRDQAFLSKRLAGLHLDVPVKISLEETRRREPKAEACRELFTELEFHNLLKEFGGQGKTLSSDKYHLICQLSEFHPFLEKLKQASVFSVDTETTSLDPLKARLVGLSFALVSGEAYYLALGHRAIESQLPLDEVIQSLKPLLEDSKIQKYAQNFKYDAHVLANHGIQLSGLRCDTMLASYLLDPASSHKLDNLSSRYLNHQMISFEEVAGKSGDFAQVEPAVASQYSCEDADVTLQLAELFLPKIEEAGLAPLLQEVELPLSSVLLKMERIGIKIDRNFLLKLQSEFGERMLGHEKKVKELAGEDFNLQSPKQLATILFEKLQLPAVKKTKTGYSTDVEVLTELSKLHELPKELLEHRSLAKLKSTYVDALLALANPATDRVHTSFNQSIAETGRLSSSDPNLQNIPIRSEDGAKIRQAFIAESGFTLLSADYSQIELRVLAHLSNDPILLAAFADDLDIHRMTAARIFDVHEGLVTAQMRASGKTVNFGVVYGQTPFGLSGQLGVTQAQAKKYIEQYFEKYSGVREYRERVLAEARRCKEVRTLMGRRRFVPDIDSKNTMSRNFAERIAFNTVIQGSAADIIKMAMIHIDREMQKSQLSSHLLLQVHDELVFEMAAGEAELLRDLVRQGMEAVVDFKVPLKVEMGEGRSWGEAH